MKAVKKNVKFDYFLLTAVLALVALGVVMVYSSSFYNMIVKHNSPQKMLYEGLKFAGAGTIGMFVMSLFNYKKLFKLVPFLYITAITLSGAVLIFGKRIYGAKRWIDLGVMNGTIMPSEIAKIAIIFTFAGLVSLAGDRIKGLRQYSLMLGLLSALCLLTAVQPDFSTAALMFTLGLIMLFIARVNMMHLLSTTGILMLAGVGYVSIAEYRIKRVLIWWHNLKDTTYVFEDARRQITYSVYALSSGGMNGAGLGMSELKNLRLPEPYNDFIFAIIGEELGFIGSVLVLLLFTFVIFRVFSIAFHCKDIFGFMIAAGTGVLISLQVVINVGVVLNLLPTTGIPLPFVSKGGTSLIILMMLMGVVLNISLQNKLHEVSS
ncbi:MULTISPECIES: FtsW/RodA/SpoVE family cell cycle protein [unclassified Fusibacter]|uniref:FtsW/RodA/SpoVE family cell cycle protein n=1 Tax=unclassified Fusibacter TaxID=2624464 RepID=UPI0010105AA0|nr:MULTISPECIES: putative peptidoglycan glycosyltransferase FtsW [unclassified Fusibacter]MCK8061318.1 putative lipid II flippase FtsW [Fusibacter sp. A2]NPE23485.1 cell division protein FtsW [Fusibacter sp. A1]RXV59091.1 cell division protein FtsW [Fusibacter sp. A1]